MTPTTATSKTCSICGVEKPLEEFSRATTGRHSQCKECKNARWRKDYGAETRAEKPRRKCRTCGTPLACAQSIKAGLCRVCRSQGKGRDDEP